MRYNKDMTISEILFSNPKTLEVFKKYGLVCPNCFGAKTATLEIASRVNGIELEKILCDLERLS